MLTSGVGRMKVPRLRDRNGMCGSVWGVKREVAERPWGATAKSWLNLYTLPYI